MHILCLVSQWLKLNFALTAILMPARKLGNCFLIRQGQRSKRSFAHIPSSEARGFRSLGETTSRTREDKAACSTYMSEGGIKELLFKLKA